MDYSTLSDFEINCEVLAVFSPDINHMCLSGDNTCFYDCGPTGEGWNQINIPDYCNTPADAWPIIVDNLISIDWHFNGSYKRVWGYSEKGLVELKCLQFDILRAAMIVFLEMQENKQ